MADEANPVAITGSDAPGPPPIRSPSPSAGADARSARSAIYSA